MNTSSATIIPSISSLFTFSPRPTVSLFGELFNRAALIRSARPSKRPALCGPRIPLPPEKVSRSQPIFTYLVMFSTGGVSAAASLNAGMPRFFPNAMNSSALIWPSGSFALKNSIIAVRSFAARSISSRVSNSIIFTPQARTA